MVPRGAVKLILTFNALACPTFVERPTEYQGLFSRLSHHKRALVFARLILCLPLFFRLPQLFLCIREQAQKYCSPVLVGLLREQLVKVLDVA